MGANISLYTKFVWFWDWDNKLLIFIQNKKNCDLNFFIKCCISSHFYRLLVPYRGAVCAESQRMNQVVIKHWLLNENVNNIKLNYRHIRLYNSMLTKNIEQNSSKLFNLKQTNLNLSEFICWRNTWFFDISAFT